MKSRNTAQGQKKASRPDLQIYVKRKKNTKLVV